MKLYQYFHIYIKDFKMKQLISQKFGNIIFSITVWNFCYFDFLISLKVQILEVFWVVFLKKKKKNIWKKKYLHVLVFSRAHIFIKSKSFLQKDEVKKFSFLLAFFLLCTIKNNCACQKMTAVRKMRIEQWMLF